MKQLSKYLIALLLIITALGSSSLAEAAPGGPNGRGGGGGEVTAVGADSITILNRNGDSVVVNVDENTIVRLVATQSEGSLSDISVGDDVRVRGRRAEDGSVTARSITVQPDGDKVRGRVTEVNGSTISLENRDGTVSVTTDGSTTFYLNGEAASLADVAAGNSVTAYGTTQADGSVSATLVLIRSRSGGNGR